MRHSQPMSHDFLISFLCDLIMVSTSRSGVRKIPAREPSPARIAGVNSCVIIPAPAKAMIAVTLLAVSCCFPVDIIQKPPFCFGLIFLSRPALFC